MAAAKEHPGDFVLHVADTGAALMISFAKFITYRKAPEISLDHLYATITITTSFLRELGNTLNQYENGLLIKDEITRPISQKCKDYFNKLLVLVTEGNSQGIWKHDGSLGGEPASAEVDPLFFIAIGVGGWGEMRHFCNSFNDAKDTLVRLKDTVKYMILKDLNEKNLLQTEQVEELRTLTAHLPHLVQSFEKAEEQKKICAEWAVRATELNNPGRDGVAMSSLRRSVSRAFSDSTLPVNHERNNDFEFMKDVDRESIYSVQPRGPRPFQVTNDVYEEWLLQYYEDRRTISGSRGFLGLNFMKTYCEDPGFWSTSPELRTQAEMKKQHQSAAGDMSAAEHKAAMQKAAQAIPKSGGRSIDRLIQDRTDACSHEAAKCQWSVVAIRPQQKYPYGSAKKWGKDPLTTDWIVTIKGETIDTAERHRPNVGEDSWRRRVIYPERHYPRRRPYREVDDIEMVPRRPYPNVVRPREERLVEPRLPRYNGIDDELQNGMIVIGKLMSREDAEKKLEKIWFEMNKEASIEAAS